VKEVGDLLNDVTHSWKCFRLQFPDLTKVVFTVHPSENLAKFGYKQDTEVLKKN
jgi:hypothetical protein